MLHVIEEREANEAEAQTPSTLQHDDPQIDPHHNDPHDDIVAILRDGAPRVAHDPSELRISPADHVAGSASPAPPLAPALRPPPLNDDLPLNAARPRPRRRVMRFVFTVCVGIAATIGWQSYGEAARRMLADWVPQLAAIAPGQAQQASAAEEQSPPPVQSAAEAAPVQAPAVAAAPAATTAAPAQAAPPQAAPPDLAPMLEDMSREIASLRQTIEQLKAGQQQISRDLAKAAEQEPKRRVASPAPPPRPAAAQRTPAPLPPPARSMASQLPPPPVTTQPVIVPQPSPVQLPPEPGFASAPRPPRPLP